MRARSLMLSFGTLALVSMVAVEVSAEEKKAPRPPKTPAEAPFFVGITGGAGYATLQHPLIAKEIAGTGGRPVSFGTAAIDLHAGYTFGEHLGVALEFGALETGISRNNAGETFKLGFSPQAECTSCHAPLHGSDVLATTVVFSNFGARVEYTPLGRDGLFVGGSAGVAMMVGYADMQGGAFAGRLGYRFRPSGGLTISLEAGVQGQVYDQASLYMPYGAAVLRPYF